MLGAIIGDIIGSRFEWSNIRSKQFRLFDRKCRPTDDSIMTLAVAKGLLESTGLEDLSDSVIDNMHYMGQKYPRAGYGGRFHNWIVIESREPYNSWGNGAGMRVSPCAWAARSLEEAVELSDIVTAVTHNHPEGIKGARAITAAVFLARTGMNKEEIRDHIETNYYTLDFTLDQIRPKYDFDVSCQGSVPQAIEAFLESESYEDAVRGAISIGGDSDTIADMTGAIAQAYWGIPDEIRAEGLSFLDDDQIQVLNDFEAHYGTK